MTGIYTNTGTGGYVRRDPLAAAKRKKRQASWEQYIGTIKTLDLTTGRSTVLIQGQVRSVFAGVGARNAKVGDSVTVVKTTGGQWRIEKVNTYRTPPTIPDPGTPPANATTISGSRANVPTRTLPRPTTVPPASYSAGWALDSVNRPINQLINAFNELIDYLVAERTRNTTLDDALNTNASRLNGVRDQASAAGAVVGVIKDEGMAR